MKGVAILHEFDHRKEYLRPGVRVWVTDFGEAPIPDDLWRKYRKAFRDDGWFDGRRKRLAAEAKAELDALVDRVGRRGE